MEPQTKHHVDLQANLTSSRNANQHHQLNKSRGHDSGDCCQDALDAITLHRNSLTHENFLAGCRRCNRLGSCR